MGDLFLNNSQFLEIVDLEPPISFNTNYNCSSNVYLKY